MAPRTIATATISFGLVSIPVKLFTSTRTSETISFRMLHEKCKSPVKYRYFCENDNELVERDNIVKGFEYRKNEFVIFSDEELKKLEEEATRAVAIEEFVPLSAVDPVFYDKAYYLGPERGGERAYQLLARAMREKQIGGLARYAARGKQYLVLLRPVESDGDRLVMQQLRYADEVRDVSEVPVDTKAEVKEAELNLAFQLIDQTTSQEFHPERYSDEVKDRIREIIDQKVEGEEVSFAPAEAPKAQVIDLMEALKSSLGQPGGGAATGDGGEEAESGQKIPPRKASKPATGKSAKRKASG